MARLVTINNIKEGVAKTTTATNLAAGLVRKGKRSHYRLRPLSKRILKSVS